MKKMKKTIKTSCLDPKTKVLSIKIAILTNFSIFNGTEQMFAQNSL